MGTRNGRGVLIPTAGEGLITAWENFADTVGVVVAGESIAGARAALTNATNKGLTISPSYPAYFNIKGIIYAADGAKNGSTWVLQPINQVEVDEVQYTVGAHVNLAHAAMSTMVKSALPVRPYDRVVVATAFAYGRVTKGGINLGLRIGTAANQAEARFDPSGPCSVCVTHSGVVRADEIPNIELGPVGDNVGGTSTIEMGVAGKLSKLVTIAYPITMG